VAVAVAVLMGASSVAGGDAGGGVVGISSLQRSGQLSGLL